MQVVERPDVLFDAARSRRMSDICAPCFTLILQLRTTSDFGAPEVLRSRTKGLLDGMEREARRSGFASDELRDAHFALVAFIDETILSSDWMQKNAWVARPLQLELFDRFDAGEEFFTRLERLLVEGSEQAELIEVYFLCLALGFKGMYQIHDQERLRQTIEDTHSFLQRQPGFSARALSPRGRPRGQVVAQARSTVPPWMIAIIAAVVAILAYVGVRWYVSDSAAELAAGIEEVMIRPADR